MMRDQVTEQYTEDLQSRTQWLAASGALKLVILNTIPHDTYEYKYEYDFTCSSES
jgi:hypothetical protein